MKKILLLTLLGALLVSCTGDRGPAGPVGPEGPPSATIIYVVGVISAGDYEGDWIALRNSSIRADAVTQVYISEDRQTHAWITVDYQFGTGVVYIHDPNQAYIGWDLLIMIIPNAGG